MLLLDTHDKSAGKSPLAHIPGNDGLPVFGHSFEVLLNLRGLFGRMHERHGPVFRMNLFDRSVVFLGPDAVQTILLDRAQNFSSAGAYARVLGSLFSTCVMMQDFDHHSYTRQLLLPAFRRPAMEDYLRRMNPLIERAVERWAGQQDFRFYPASRELTLNVAASVFLGLELGPDVRRVNEAMQKLLKAPMAIIRKRIPGLAYAKGLKAKRFLTEYLRAVIPQRRRDPSGDMLSQLCQATTEAGEQFSDDEVIDHMIFMIIAAYDTTTSALTGMAYLLAKHPEWQERLRAESAGLGEGHLSYQGAKTLKSAELVLKETLRLHPPIVMIARKVVRDCEIEGVRIPAGTPIWVSPDFTHQMDAWWSSPQTFDPERFGEERAEHKRHRFSYMPYGGGAHMCIGFHFGEMMLKAVLHQLLLKYRLRLPAGHKAKFRQIPTTKPKDNLPLALEPLAASPPPRGRAARHVPHDAPAACPPRAAVCPYGHS